MQCSGQPSAASDGRWCDCIAAVSGEDVRWGSAADSSICATGMSWHRFVLQSCHLIAQFGLCPKLLSRTFRLCRNAFMSSLDQPDFCHQLQCSCVHVVVGPRLVYCEAVWLGTRVAWNNDALTRIWWLPATTWSSIILVDVSVSGL